MNQAFKSIMKTAIALIIAGVVLGGGIWAIDEWKESKERHEDRLLEIQRYFNVEADVLGLKFNIVTKYSQGYMSYRVSTDKYPEFMKDRRLAEVNKDGVITLRGADYGGFEVTSIPIKLNQVTRIMGDDGEYDSISYEGKILLSRKDYQDLSDFTLRWKLLHKLPKEDEVKPANKVVSDDHCAPGISGSERLKRLATKGRVRQIGDNDYVAGRHGLTLYSDGDLMMCN